MSKRVLKYLPFVILSLFFFSFIGSDFQTAFSADKIDSTAISEFSRPEKPAKDYLSSQLAWCDSMLNTMSLEEKVGQLLMVAAYSNKNEAYYGDLEDKIQKYHLGGLIFFQGNAIQQGILTNRYQRISKKPLLIGIDAEWGLGMRLDETVSFPKQITLGAVENAKVIEEMGREIGLQCKRLGIHINFAPVADVNTNPRNPVINYRSFGENPQKVASLTAAYARGMQSVNVMACAKHFPGHGDTDSDSHYSTPVVAHSRARLNENELVPFKRLIADSISSIMIGHLSVPALEAKINTPATVSKRIVTELLKGDLGFKGLTVTDAMNMKGVSSKYPAGGAEVAAFEAGNDLILQPDELDAAYRKLLKGFQDGSLSVTDLNNSVYKILRAKYWVGLNKPQYVDINNLNRDLNNENSDKVKEKIFREAVTVVRAESGILPFLQLDTLSIACVAVNADPSYDFYTEMSKFGKVVNYKMTFKPSARKDWDYIYKQAEVYDIMVVAVHDMNSLSRRNFGVSPETIEMIEGLSQKTKVVVVGFGNPYGMKLFDNFPNVICGYEDDPGAYKATVEILYGARGSKGKLPITASNQSLVNQGKQTISAGRLIEAEPEDVGMSRQKLNQIDDIVQEGISAHAFPGCQVLVARRGKVVFNKSYGTFSYGNSEKVTNETIYDLASLTKVSATLQAVMMLNERGELDLNRRASYYLPQLRGTNKEDLIIGDILFHQAGLRSFEAFWTHTKSKSGAFNGDFYEFNNSEGNLQVSDNVFIKPSIKDSVLQWIIESNFTSRRNRDGTYGYLYSDLGLILTQFMVEEIINQPLDQFLEQNLYEPLGMTTTTFNPLSKFPKSQIAPTEYDRIFRGSQIWGTVHDPNAALLGGVAGHAGLFSSAWDLAKLYQMNLQNGYYGGRQYLYPHTIEHFGTNYTKKSHRGIGWNKPKDGADLSSVASSASPNTFGHTGFTGTVVWVDPDRQLVFIMLSNRVYPSANNKKIMSMDIRKRIHEVINESIDLYN